MIIDSQVVLEFEKAEKNFFGDNFTERTFKADWVKRVVNCHHYLKKVLVIFKIIREKQMEFVVENVYFKMEVVSLF